MVAVYQILNALEKDDPGAALWEEYLNPTVATQLPWIGNALVRNSHTCECDGTSIWNENWTGPSRDVGNGAADDAPPEFPTGCQTDKYVFGGSDCIGDAVWPKFIVPKTVNAASKYSALLSIEDFFHGGGPGGTGEETHPNHWTILQVKGFGSALWKAFAEQQGIPTTSGTRRAWFFQANYIQKCNYGSPA